MTDTPKDAASLASALLGATAGLRRALRRHTDHVGGVPKLTEAQRDVVRTVRLNPGCRVGDIAERLELAPNTVSTLAGHLVVTGWLERSPNPDDARSTCLNLSAMAQSEVAEWRDRRVSVLAEALTQLDPEEIAAIESAAPAIRRVAALLRGES